MQGSKLYVGNLSYSVTEEELRELFTKYGTIESVKIIERKGFGFIEMSTQSEAEAAKSELNGYEFKGRSLRVNEAKPRENLPGRNYKRR